MVNFMSTKPITWLVALTFLALGVALGVAFMGAVIVLIR